MPKRLQMKYLEKKINNISLKKHTISKINIIFATFIHFTSDIKKKKSDSAKSFPK